MARYETTQYDETTFKHKQQLDMKRKSTQNNFKYTTQLIKNAEQH